MGTDAIEAAKAHRFGDLSAVKVPGIFPGIKHLSPEIDRIGAAGTCCLEALQRSRGSQNFRMIFVLHN